MTRLNLVIADPDEGYLESMVSFLLVKYSKKFEINSFTRKELLIKYLCDEERVVDILLVSPELYSKSMDRDNIKSVILLSNGRLNEEFSSFELVNKYQHGDKLVNQLLKIYSDKNTGEVFIPSDEKMTKVIGVFSPSGGSGKTTVAISLCLESARQGFSVFYLNMESIPSTASFFSCESEHNLSNIFFYVKQKNKNLGLRIEALRSVDKNKIHYFSPQDSMTELDEMLPEELAALLCQLKSLNQYDVIIIDMSSDLKRQNLELLRECDDIVMVLVQEAVAEIKLKQVVKEFEIISARQSINLMDRAKIVMNKYCKDIPDIAGNLQYVRKDVSAYLPLASVLSGSMKMLDRLDSKSEFHAGISQLFEQLMAARVRTYEA